MRIAGKHTAKQWMALKKRLQSQPSPRLWDIAFHRFYRMRIDTRYLHPIASIQKDKNDTQSGEGFAIAALFCTLIEFLESCERGDNFCIDAKTGNKDHLYNLQQASGYFKDFLKARKPFDNLIPSELVEPFYADVRCGLLHEARTKGGWFISAAKSGRALVCKKGGKTTLFRNQLVPALEKHFVEYRRRLLADESGTRDAFIRKFDHLCKA